MARPIATREQVFAAADALAEAGIEPTLLHVQKQVGGSFSTVKKHLHEWWQAQSKEAQIPQLPEDLQQYGLEALQKIWGMALEYDKDRVMHAQAEAQRQIEEARAQQRSADQIVEHLEGDLDKQREQAETLRAEVAELHATIETLRGKQSTAEAKALAAEARVEELKQQLDAQHRELAEVRVQLLTQAEQAGEITALRRQVEQQAALLERLNYKEVSA